MSRAVALLIVLALAACTQKPIETRASNNGAVPVDTLFTHDGCTVYRFEDDGRHHYYTRCATTVTTESPHLESCGKNCSTTQGESIQTEIRNGQ